MNMIACKYFAQGRCTKGGNCPFWHNPNTQEPKIPNLIAKTVQPHASTKAPPCKYFAQGYCSRGEQCRFDHSNCADLSPAAAPPDDSHTKPQEDSRGSVPCKFHIQGTCKNGEKCPFLHEERPVPAPNESMEDEKDNFARTIGGALVQFEDGGRVAEIILPSDFSAVHIAGLPFDYTAIAVATLLTNIGAPVPETSIRVFRDNDGKQAHADITVKDKAFAAKVSSEATLKDAQVLLGAGLQISEAPVRLPGMSFRRIDGRKIHCSWHRPTRTVWLNFGNKDIAQRVSDKFKKGVYTIQNSTVKSSSVQSAGGIGHNPMAYTVILSHVPAEASEFLIKASIRQAGDRPRHIELGKPSYPVGNEAVAEQLRSRLSDFGGLELFEMQPSEGKKRYKATARFQNETAATEAVRAMNGHPQVFLGNGKIDMKVAYSIKEKVRTATYDILSDQLWELQNKPEWQAKGVRFQFYRNSDRLEIFTTLKIEADTPKAAAEANSAIQKITSGIIARTSDGTHLWCTSFKSNSSSYLKVKSLEKELGIQIVRDKRNQQLRFLGSPTSCKTAIAKIQHIMDADSSVQAHEIMLEPQNLQWACNGGFRNIATTLGDNIASFDIVSNPKRIVIRGSQEQYDLAMAVMQGKYVVKPTKVSRSEDSTCSICWTDAENPVATLCGHVYCLECFENLCLSGDAGNEYTVICQGAMGKCNKLLALAELQNHLSSSALEGVLETSFRSYVTKNPQLLRYCPTADCGAVYRVTSQPYAHYCSSCFELICTACHNQHPGEMTCAEYKDIASGGYEAFERLKKEMNMKDCPRCGVTMDKIEGCNHMTCRCGAHVCWVCLADFRTSGECYAHMNKAHGGIGLDHLQQIGF
ncbi:hypothetical protein PRK78_002541 [Emydomyces testavorans]|uniref:Uncharacterized protein n=1 Tax=Emydomyces testavorans TaxID=2070801 RepID=A0AAF0DGG3_9EURO|nr:hypothetical protein PRK78_002541 [Emydomyces testavorans]